MSSPTRNFGLDLLRALAIVSVVLGHGIAVLARLTIGVELFFVLSGFLIGRIYFQSRNKGTFSLSQFWVARWWRTYPPYLAALLVIAFAQRWIPTNPLNWHYLFFMQTFTGIKGFGPSWSLCVEEHFYLAFPLLALAAERVFKKHNFIWLMPAALLLPTLTRLLAFAVSGGVTRMPGEWFHMTPFHCDGLIAGVFLAYMYVEQPFQFWESRKLAIFCAPLVLISFLATPMLKGQFAFELLNNLALAVGFAGCLRLALSLRWTPTSLIGRTSAKLVRVIALTSYSVYLIHTLVFTDMRVLLAQSARGVSKTALIFAVTLAMSGLFYFLFDRTSVWTRDWFMNKRAIGARTSPASTGPSVVRPLVTGDSGMIIAFKIANSSVAHPDRISA